MNVIKEILLWLWQLPQNLLGLILILFYKPEACIILQNGNKVYFSRNMVGGISLGKYSIINSYYAGLKTGDKTMKPIEELVQLDVVKHEGIGHGTQSRYLGWFYLLIIGLPSIVWAGLYGSVIPYTVNGYYKFPTEASADRIAGIKR